MSGKQLSVEDRLGTLSKGKARLLELLLEKEAAHARGIRPFPRGNSNGALRLPASWAQQQLWFVDQLEGGGAAYNVPMVISLKGLLDRQALEMALNALIHRHEVLRTTFVNVDGEPTQEIADRGHLPLAIINLSGTEAELETQIRLQRAEETQGRFDLRAGPLMRGRLLRVDADRHVLLLTLHHIICDGWSIGILIRELADLYQAYREGRESPLEPLPIQYADYAQWQRQRLQGEMLEQQLGYWRARLEGAAPELELPTDRPQAAVHSYRGDNVPIVLDADLAASLRRFAQSHGMTLFMLLHAAWSILLFRLSGQQDVLVGTPVANRPRRELEGLIGFFVNTVVLRVTVSGDMHVKEFLEQVKEVTLAAYENQDVPFEKLVEELRPRRTPGRNPFFQVMFALQNVPSRKLLLPGMDLRMEDAASGSSKFDLLLALEERGTQIAGTMNYATDLFDRSTMERWAACFTTLLRAITGQVARIGDLSILPESERRQIVESFNATEAPYPRERLVHELFEQQVRRTPQSVAVTCDGESLTYEQLNGRGNQLARYLRGQGVATGDYVPLVMRRSLDLLVAYLGVLKAGAAYMPMDPDSPAKQREFMIRDCGARHILADDEPPADIDLGSIQWIDCVRSAEAIRSRSMSDLKLQIDSTPPAYVMYTSGSTGLPKGVVVSHHGVNNVAINEGYARIGPDDCLVHYSNPAFDASTFEIWGALLNGARVVIVHKMIVLEADRFAEVLRKERVTVLWMSVGLFNQCIDTLAEVFSELRYLIVGGDSLDPSSIGRVLLRDKRPLHLLNAYGPTECTTFSTTHRIESVGEKPSNIPIGSPIANARIYILDQHHNVVPIGVCGEIYIGGAGVARGYLNRPELTAERFVADPFCADPQARLYKTGDLARWRPDGAIEFLGRNDRQVKIRGFRVELGEIEAQLARHCRVRDVAVLAREDVPGEKRLVAYVVPQESETDPSAISAAMLRAHLEPLLPEYMVPKAFVMLERLPLTVNGKLDRRALPKPEPDAYASELYAAPQGEVEEGLAEIWQTLLRVDRIGRGDNFFELGGHSLHGMKLIARIEARFGVALSAIAIFKYPTIQSMASVIECQRPADVPTTSTEMEFDDGVL